MIKRFKEFFDHNPDYIIIFFFGIIFTLLFLFFHIKVLNADIVSYFDYDQVVVSELPEASVSTLDKVFIVDDHFFITDEIFIGGSPVSYSWVEIDKFQAVDIVDHRDFYLFYDFDSIKNFNIFSSYDFDSFSDFQKLVVVIGVNILFLSFLFIVIYIILRLIYKGLSLIFD